VLGRSLEEFIVGEIRAIALANGCSRIAGHYVRSARNGLVAGLYERLGFTLDSDNDGETRWSLRPCRDELPWQSWVQRACEETPG
jgi:predicted enzyme involved in methoxymalonyl-ACP biosynthesis